MAVIVVQGTDKNGRGGPTDTRSGGTAAEGGHFSCNCWIGLGSGDTGTS